jgi:hypothetical protein
LVIWGIQEEESDCATQTHDNDLEASMEFAGESVRLFSLCLLVSLSGGPGGPMSEIATFPHFDQLESVRHTVRCQFIDLGCDCDNLEEMILIRDGFYCGRRFRVDGHQAVWFCEENELKFYDCDGHLSRVVRPLVARAASQQRVA